MTVFHLSPEIICIPTVNHMVLMLTHSFKSAQTTKSCFKKSSPTGLSEIWWLRLMWKRKQTHDLTDVNKCLLRKGQVLTSYNYESQQWLKVP